MRCLISDSKISNLILEESYFLHTFLENEQLVSEMLDLYFENRSIELRQKLVQLNLNLVKIVIMTSIRMV